MQSLADWRALSRTQKFHAWFVVLLAAFFFFYEFIQMNMFNSLSTSFEQTFALNALQIGLISAFYFLSDSILLYPIGIILDRYSSRKMILFGMVLCITGTLLISVAQNPWFLVLARFLAGSAAAFCLLSILRLAIQWFPAEKMGQITGIVVTIGMLGGAVSQAPLTWLIGLVGWREALRDVAVLGVVFLVLIFMFVKDAPPSQAFSLFQTKEHHLSLWQNFKNIIKNKANWLAAFYIATMNLPIMLLAGLFGTQFMVQSYGFTDLQGSTISMMIFIGTIVGSTLIGWWSDVISKRRLPMLVFAWLSLILFLIILYGPKCSYFVYVILFFALGLTTAAQIIGYPVTRELNPSSLAGSALGFISVIIMGLPALLQPLTGYLIGLGSLHTTAVYTLADYRRGLILLVIGFIISIVMASRIKESYGVKTDEV